jgi:hypothetical protein
MIKLMNLIEGIISVSKLDDILDIYRSDTNWTDWYMSGGCYTFSDALNKFIGNKGKYVAVIEHDTDAMVHVCILYNGKYCDYNGCRTKNSILSDISVNGKTIWKTISLNDIKTEHNFDKREVATILKDLNKINDSI